MSTENNVAAQAGDEPMLPEPRAIRAGHSFPKVYALAYTADQMREFYRAGAVSAHVSPRATADVERDSQRLEFMMERGAWIAWCKDGETCRVFHINEDGATGPIMGWVPEAWFHDPRKAIDAAIATTKPGA